jgi:hypothetical protein
MTVTATVFERGNKQQQGMFSDMWLVSATIDPASVAAEATGSDTLTVPGVALGDMVLGWSSGLAVTDNLVVQVTVSAANTLKVQYTNNNLAAGAAIDLASSTWRFVIGRPINA